MLEVVDAMSCVETNTYVKFFFEVYARSGIPEKAIRTRPRFAFQ
jgi:hypothetical protein